MFYQPVPSCQIPNLGSFYEELFGVRKEGCFIEIGAYDGETVSNTSCLADLGWTGIYVEPVKQYAEVCAQRHRRNQVTVVNCAVGDRPGRSQISVGQVLSSMANHHIEQFKQLDWSRSFHSNNLQEVEVITPPQLLNRCFPGGIPSIDLLVVDVEGYELPVIRAWDFDQCKPQVIIVELRDLDPQFNEDIRQEGLDVLRLLKRSGYSVFWRDQTNTILKASSQSSHTESVLVF